MKRTIIQFGIITIALLTMGLGCSNTGASANRPPVAHATTTPANEADTRATGTAPQPGLPVPDAAEWEVATFERQRFRLWHPPAYRVQQSATSTAEGELKQELQLELTSAARDTHIRFAVYDTADPVYVRYNPFIAGSGGAAAFVRHEPDVARAEQLLMGPVFGLWFEKERGRGLVEYNFVFTHERMLYRAWTTAPAIDAPAVEDMKMIVRQLEFIEPTGLDW